jgi:hypothetical protein
MKAPSRGAGCALDDVRVEFDAAVVEEADETVPVVQTIAELVGKFRTRRRRGPVDARARS